MTDVEPTCFLAAAELSLIKDSQRDWSSVAHATVQAVYSHLNDAVMDLVREHFGQHKYLESILRCVRVVTFFVPDFRLIHPGPL